MHYDDLMNLLHERKYSELRRRIMEIQVADIAEFIEELNITEALLVYRMLPKNLAIEVFAFLDLEKQTQLSTLVSEAELSSLIQELYLDDKIDLLEELPASVVKKILANTAPNERKLINQFLNYPEDSAGSLMTIEFVDLKENMTISAAMERIRKVGRGKETIYTCYVTDSGKKLQGLMSLKELVLSDPAALVGDLMKKDVIYVSTHVDQEHIANEFKKYDLLSMPVVDGEDRLVGIITIDDVVDVIDEEATEDFQLLAATIPTDEEYMDTTPFSLAKRRIFWLAILMFSAVLTELITTTNTKITTEFVILVALMPMLMSTGGNAGAQASTLVIRGITLGEIKFKDLLKVVFKEIRVGLIVGTTLGILNFLRLLITGKDLRIALVIGLTLISTTTMAALLGGTLPILAKKLKLDPAIMANPLITTITDATTLLIFFAISTLVLL